MSPNRFVLAGVAMALSALAARGQTSYETQAQNARISAWQTHQDWALAQTTLIDMKTQVDTDYAVLDAWYNANQAEWSEVKRQAVMAEMTKVGGYRTKALNCRNWSATFGASGDSKYNTGDYYFYTEQNWPAAIHWYGQATSSWTSATNQSLDGINWCYAASATIATAYIYGGW
jgi:hypothetical protein